MIYANFETILVPEANGKQNLESLIGTNIKNILLRVMTINQYVLMIRRSAHRDCNVNVHKIPVRFCNLKSYDSHLIMQELGKFNLKINAIPNGIEKYQYINTINNKLIFIDSFQFLNSSLHSVVKNLGKDGFKYLSQEFDVLDRIRSS